MNNANKTARPARKIALASAMVALALALSAIEAMIPMPIPVPGVKLGLPNLVVLVALYLFGAKFALKISVARILLAGLLFGSGSSILYALSGGVCSFVAMWLAKKWLKLSVYSVSMVGGIVHNVGQLIVAGLVVRTLQLGGYLPALILFGAATGLVNGIVGKLLIASLEKMAKRMLN